MVLQIFSMYNHVDDDNNKKIVFVCVIEWDHTELLASFNLAMCL